MAKEPIVVIDSVENADWMHTLPGYKDEVSVIKIALAKLGKVSKQFFRIVLNSQL
jgi:hypothetical protein